MITNLNKTAGKATFEKSLDFYQKNKKHIRFMAGHYLVMSNAYDYICLTFPEKPLKNFLSFRDEANKVDLSHITNSKTKQQEIINISKSLALEDFIKSNN